MGNSDSKTKEKNAIPKPPQRPSPTVPSVTPPQPFLTMDEFFENWQLWKDAFLKYKASAKGSTQTEWENTLLNLMGPIGQEIYAKIKSPHQGMKLDTLLKEFDEYRVFQAKRRLPRECIYEYMDELQEIIRWKNVQHGEDVIRQRILVEINQSEFTDAAKKLIPNFVFSSAYNSMTLKEIAFFWNFYISQKNCTKCGYDHTDSKSCPAIGKQCKKCNKLDHYTRRCPNSFIFNCKYCGGGHRIGHCPAFGETCTKCNKPNHFYWKCQLPRICQCRFCGMSHSADRSICPAVNTYCMFCSMKGHFSSKCTQRLRTHRT